MESGLEEAEGWRERTTGGQRAEARWRLEEGEGGRKWDGGQRSRGIEGVDKTAHSVHIVFISTARTCIRTRRRTSTYTM